MKHLILSAVALFSLNVILAPAPAEAQQEMVRVTIPFDFKIAEKTYPAGDYKVSRLSTAPGIVLRTVDNRTAVIALTNGPHNVARNQSVLRFNRYGEQYFLSQMLSNGMSWTLFTSPAEKELIARGSALTKQSVVASTR